MLLQSRVGLCGQPFGRLCADVGGGVERVAGWVDGSEVYHTRGAAQWLPYASLGGTWIYDRLTVVHPVVGLHGQWRPFPGGFQIIGASSDHSVSPLGLQLSVGVRANFL